MTILLATDLHLDDNPRNSDRWNLFPWLREQVKRRKPHQLILLGDITDAKDRHSNQLVNRLVDEFASLSKLVPIIALPGNHDGLQDGYPFFRFVQHLDNITYILKPRQFKIPGDGNSAVFLPNSRDPKAEWGSTLDDLATKMGGDIARAVDYIFCHQTFDGCVVENGSTLSGFPPSYFEKFRGTVYSGDIHVPQRMGKNIVYIGAPYRIHFGDKYGGRCLLLNGSKYEELFFPARGRELIDCSSIAGLKDAARTIEMGAQVKIRFTLARKEMVEWPEMRKKATELAAKLQWEVCGLELKLEQRKQEQVEDAATQSTKPADMLKGFISRKKLDPDLAATGKRLLKEVL